MLYSTLYCLNAVVLGSIVFTIYNRIITLRERARTALRNIDIELKRRKEIIPTIVHLVEEYSKHEKNIHNVIAQMRVRIAYEDTPPTGRKDDLSPLLAVIERYPKLQASENYQKLMYSLTDAEERIAYSRAFYNRNVRKLNTLVSQFPFNIIAYMFQIKQMAFISFIQTKK